MNTELLKIRGNLSKAIKYDSYYLDEATAKAVAFLKAVNPTVDLVGVRPKTLLKLLDNHMYGRSNAKNAV